MSFVLRASILVVTWYFWLIDPCVAKSTEWYQECKPGECGFAGKKGSSNCQDAHEDCGNFARHGECFANPEWMHENCRLSCGLCVAEDDESGTCKDLHSNCAKWAGEFECLLNPAYMSRACPQSCLLCIDKEELKKAKVPEEKIQKLLRFSQTDWGLWQKLPENDDKGVRKEIEKMALYMRSLENVGPGSACNNLYHECALWKVRDNACETDTEFMLKHCSLVCQFCDYVDAYHTCRNKRVDSPRKPFGDMETVFSALINEESAENILHEKLEDRKVGEWIFSMNKTAFFNSSEEESQKLVKLLQSDKVKNLVWKNASGETYTNAPSDLLPVRSGRVAVCGSECVDSNPTFQALKSTLSNLLEIDMEYFMPLEFVHYTRGERFATHHDFRLHDQWKDSGNHVLTVFLGLQSPEKGGNFGFPELDWLLFERPQVLIWPNVGKNLKEPLERLKSEQLPVVEGELYGVYAYVRQYAFDESSPCM